MNALHKPEPYAPPASGSVTAFDLNELVSIDMLRQHTKTEDIPSVTDEQIALYRKAAVQSAEKYTGKMLLGTKSIVEPVDLPGNAASTNRRSNHFYHTAKNQFSSPIAWLYGHKNRAPVQVQAPVGERRIKLPLIIDTFGIGCCNPCADIPQSQLLYTAGYSCIEEMPAGIALGVLKYVAHVMENAGDIVVATNEAGGSSTGSMGVGAAADPAVASGALAIWRATVDSAI